jgi:hypothetical protein
MAQNICFTNIYIEILLHVLGCSFFTKHHILAHFCPILLTFKASKINCAKLLRFGAKNVDEMERNQPQTEH